MPTVTTVKFELDKNGLLKCPLNLKGQVEGDSTVPLTSQEALVHQGDKKAKLVGKTIVGGKHAEICTHKDAMTKVCDLLTGEFVAGVRTQTEGKQA